MRKYSFLTESFKTLLEDGEIDPNTGMPMDPSQQQGGGDTFEPLIKSAKDIPLSKDGVERLKVAAQIRQIEAKTKEIEAKTQQAQMGVDPSMAGGDPSMGGGIDPNTGMPMDPMAQQGAIDPMTGMPMDGGMPPGQDPNQNDPLRGLGDRSAGANDMGGGMMGGMGGGIDPMTGQPLPGGDSSMPFTAIGRAYKLKELFKAINTIDKILKKQSDEDLLTLSTQVDKAFDLFKLIVNNLKSYKDQIDNIIIMYYSLLKDVSDTMSKILREKKLENSVN